MKKQSFSERQPVLASLLVTFLFLFGVSIGGAISSMTSIDTQITLFVAYFVVAAVLVILINRKKNWSYYGFNGFNVKEKQNLYLYIPLFFMALLPLVAGIASDLEILDVFYIIFFMAIVAFVEETIFRGIILKLLQKKSVLFAIIGSSLLFSIPHILNALSGKELSQTLFQITFALLIGMILAILLIKTNNIVLLIIYHFLNNSISSITNTNISDAFSLTLNIVVLIIGTLYLGFLFYHMSQKGSKNPKVKILR